MDKGIVKGEEIKKVEKIKPIEKCDYRNSEFKNSIYATIGELVDLGINLGEIKEVFYRHKVNPENTFKTLEDAERLQVNFSDYEKVEETINGKDEFLKAIFNSSDIVIDESKIDTFKKIIKILEEIKNIKIPKVKTPFEIESLEARQIWDKAKSGKSKVITEQEAEKNFLAVYEKHGRTYKPRQNITKIKVEKVKE
ncbi:MAG: hypothetical protein GZ094_05365 [Mariniphaga sp.]|nr:hypothetical protein [Mariniphaga sp.]